MIRYRDEGDKSLWLLSDDELAELPEGTVVESNLGYKTIYRPGKPLAQHGFCALFASNISMTWGVRDPFNHDEKDLFLMMLLKKK